MMIAVALTSNPKVGSSMKIIDGFAMSSIEILNHFLCSIHRLVTLGKHLDHYFSLIMIPYNDRLTCPVQNCLLLKFIMEEYIF